MNLGPIDHAAGTAASPDGRLLAVGGHNGRVELHDLDRALRGADSLLHTATHESGRRLSNLQFDDSGTLLITRDLFQYETTVWEVTDGLRQAWSRQVPLRYHDGMMWRPAGDGAGVVGFPLATDEYADYARTLPTTELTEQECQTYLERSCSDFDALLASI